MQTWLLYHNAISAGVEVQDILKHARTSKETTHVVADEVNQLKKQVDAQQALIRQMMEQQQLQQPRHAAVGGPASTSSNSGASGKRFAFPEKDTELTGLMQRSPEPTFSNNNNNHTHNAATAMTLQTIPSYGATSNTAQPPAQVTAAGVLQGSGGSSKSAAAVSPRGPAPVALSRNSSNTTANNASSNGNVANNAKMPPKHVRN